MGVKDGTSGFFLLSEGKNLMYLAFSVSFLFGRRNAEQLTKIFTQPFCFLKIFANKIYLAISKKSSSINMAENFKNYFIDDDGEFTIIKYYSFYNIFLAISSFYWYSNSFIIHKNKHKLLTYIKTMSKFD